MCGRILCFAVQLNEGLLSGILCRSANFRHVSGSTVRTTSVFDTSSDDAFLMLHGHTEAIRRLTGKHDSKLLL